MAMALVGAGALAYIARNDYGAIPIIIYSITVIVSVLGSSGLLAEVIHDAKTIAKNSK